MFNKIYNRIFKKVHIGGNDEERLKLKPKKLKSEKGNITFLLLLYMIQGIPLGISSVVPLIIQDKVSYSRLSIFSLVSLPFSMKLLWAPIVDSKYCKAIGRRKTWIVPIQALCGFLMILFSKHVNVWLENGEKDKNLYFLTLFFLFLFFLMATQDIAVDGWAITMLSKRNRHHASTCNILGQNFGESLSQLTFMTLHSKKICFFLFKKYIHVMHFIFYNSTYYKNIHENIEFTYSSFQPFLDMNSYLKLWGSFILMLTLLTFLKSEKNENTIYEQTQIVPKQNTITITTSTSTTTTTNNNNNKNNSNKKKNSNRYYKHKKKYIPLTDSWLEKQPDSDIQEETKTDIDTQNTYEYNQNDIVRKLPSENIIFEEDSKYYSHEDKKDDRKIKAEEKEIKDEEKDEKEEEEEEEDEEEEEEEDLEVVKNAYKQLHKLIQLPPIRLFVLFTVLSKFPFASVEVGTNFKILKRGITKEEFAIFNPFFIPVAILSPALIGSIMKKLKPLDVYYFGYKIRFFSNFLLAASLPITYYMYANKSYVHSSHFFFYYLYLFFAQAFNNVCVDLMTVSAMGFQNIISDPKIGGTYMTFLNTVNNLSSYVAKVTFLWLFDYTDNDLCVKGKCLFIDGYYIQMFFSVILGVLLSSQILKCINKIQDFPIESWRLDYESNKADINQSCSFKKFV